MLLPEINHGDGICIIYAFNSIYLLKTAVAHSPWNRWYEQSKSPQTCSEAEEEWVDRCVLQSSK